MIKIKIELTLAAAANAFNLDKKTLEKRLHVAGIPIAKKYALQDLCRAILTEYAEARTRVATATAEKIEAANREQEKKLIQFSLVENFMSQLFGGMFADMERILKNDFPGNLEGLSQIEIFRRGEAEFERLKEKFRQRLDKWLKENQPTVNVHTYTK